MSTYEIQRTGLICKDGITTFPQIDCPAYREYKEWLNAGNVADVEKQPEVNSVSARRNAENYILQFFSTGELMDMALKLIEGNTNAQILYGTWITPVKQEAVLHPERCDFTQFGNPPKTYLEVMA